MKSGLAAGVLAAAAVLSHSGTGAQALPDSPQVQTAQAQQIPDSPRPQTIPNAVAITPGKGSSASTDVAADDPNAPGSTLKSRPSTVTSSSADKADTVAPDIIPELGPGQRVGRLNVSVNFVQVPFTVKDNKGNLVPAVDWREVQVYESGVRQHMSFWTSDPFPLSVAFVVDQSLPYQTMNQVNTAMGAVQGAFTPYDEMAVFTYNNGTRLRTDYTGAQSPRLTAVLEQSKSEGREANFAAFGPGPLDENIEYNNHAADNIAPQTGPNHGTGGLRNNTGSLPKEQHPLNDAIFEAAKTLTNRPVGRRRIIYVVSDGRELGSKVKSKELIRFLQQNNIAVYATVVGDSSTPYIGFLDKYHIPLTLKENVLPQYASATGGQAISEFRVKGIETSFQKIAEEVRVQYTAGYYSTEPFIDGKYRPIEVRVLRPGLDVIAKKGYYPSASVIRPAGAITAQ